MTRGVRWYLVSSVAFAALIAVAGCSHYLMASREPWRHEAEVSCLNSGAVKESATRVRISAINGPGACGMDYPLRVSALGGGSALSYDDETPLRPPGSIPDSGVRSSAMPQNWPGQGYGQATSPAYRRANPSAAIQSSTLPPVPQSGQQSYPYQQYPSGQPYPSPQPYSPPPSPVQSYPSPTYRPPQSAAQVGPPLSLDPPQPSPDGDDEIGIPGGPPNPYYGGPSAPSPVRRPPRQSNERPPGAPVPPLGPADPSLATAALTPVALQPAATLACPVVSALDQWIVNAVQPAAMRWFHQPVVEIKQISAYSCRGMNGDPNAHISEHAFGNALDVAEFDLADGHRVSVQYGWHGSPEEQGFLHDVQSAACEEFTTVLAPGANVYHYNHIHVDLMRHYGGRHICEPVAIPGEVAAARVRAHYAQHSGDAGVTGSIGEKKHHHRPLSFSSEDDDSLPEAVPGED
jgi:hypothetical protein